MSLINSLTSLSLLNDLTSSSSSSTILPNQLSNLVAWFRADKGLTLSGSSVNGWADQSGTGDNNKNLVGTSHAPTLNASDASYNNQASISFASASSQYLISGTWSVSLSQPATIFVVGNTDGTSTKQFFVDGQGATQRMAIYNHSSATQLSAYAGTDLAPTGLVDGSPMAIGAVFNGASSAVYVNAKTAKITGQAGNNVITGIVVGADLTAANLLNGKCCELIYYSRALLQTEITQLLTYLTQRYSITLGN